MMFIGTWVLHFYRLKDLEESFRNLKANEKFFNIHKYYNDLTSLIFIEKIYRDEHNIYLKVFANKSRLIENDANIIANVFLRFINVEMIRVIKKKISTYESAKNNDVHMTFYKPMPLTTFELV